MLMKEQALKRPVQALRRAQQILTEAAHQLKYGEYSLELLEDAELAELLD